MESIYPGVFSFLSKLVKNQIRLAICSNKPENLCNKVLAETGLKDFFNTVIGGDTLVYKKPDPRALLHAVNLMQVDSNKALFVGDSFIDKTTSKAANIHFAFFTGGYGVGNFLESNDISFGSYELLSADLIYREKIRG
jgi:phosphoglycolate phosphatase